MQSMELGPKDGDEILQALVDVAGDTLIIAEFGHYS